MYRPFSQGICFVGNVKLSNFLSKYIKPKKGDVLHKDSVIGSHIGSAFYTPGQRHGFSTNKQKIKEKLYVVSKNIIKNTITVACKKDLNLFKSNIR